MLMDFLMASIIFHEQISKLNLIKQPIFPQKYNIYKELQYFKEDVACQNQAHYKAKQACCC